MKPAADGVWQIDGFPVNAINAYLIEHPQGDILIDAGTRWDRRRFRKALAGRRVAVVALTHVHPDHQGVARWVCEAFGAALACHEADRDVMEGRAAMRPATRAIRWSSRVFTGPARSVDRVLREGDEVGGFRVVETPGHTPGHVSFWREADGVLITGDVMVNLNFITLRPGLREPPGFFSCDAAENRRSIRKAAALRPAVCLFGHGPSLRDVGKLNDFVGRLRG